MRAASAVICMWAILKFLNVQHLEQAFQNFNLQDEIKIFAENQQQIVRDVVLNTIIPSTNSIDLMALFRHLVYYTCRVIYIINKFAAPQFQ